jgi:hypothetical protein
MARQTIENKQAINLTVVIRDNEKNIWLFKSRTTPRENNNVAVKMDPASNVKTVQPLVM